MLALLAELAPVDWLNPMPGMIVQFSIFFLCVTIDNYISWWYYIIVERNKEYKGDNHHEVRINVI